MRRYLAATVLALITTTAQAQDCNKAQSQADMNACADASFRKADAALNKTYQQIMGRLKDDEPTRKLLTTAQKAWLQFRDAECDFSAIRSEGGTIHGVIVISCQEDMTTQRTKQLQTYLKCQEGDLSCPVPAQ